ncbi:hypothetical protein N7456_013642 [Penicillium angulare]|uniref:Uncharacterized protein n=1 Tax=Penicillium angulare TaxID=116970 RepID=A0A9W9EFS1_9EURO|nr:hypothetical protein N7456_013642 [Penicillium angulare]
MLFQINYHGIAWEDMGSFIIAGSLFEASGKSHDKINRTQDQLVKEMHVDRPFSSFENLRISKTEFSEEDEGQRKKWDEKKN